MSTTPALLAVIGALAIGVAIAVVPGRRPEAAQRLRVDREPAVRTRRSTRGRWPGLVVGAGLALAIGTWWAWALVPVGALAVPMALARLEPAGVRRRRRRIAAELPWTVDLVAACLRSGAGTTATIELVAGAVDGPLAAMLLDGAALSRLGAPDTEAWAALCAEPSCARLGRLLSRTGRTGAPLADQLDVLAEDVRRDARWTADERARAVESRAVLPLTLCFLPAFLVVGVLPTLAATVVDLLPSLP